MATRDEKLEMLFKFWKLYHKQPYQMDKFCPFTKPDSEYCKTPCHQLCYIFEPLQPPEYQPSYRSSSACPCHAYGTEGALQRLEEVLRIGGYYLDMRKKTRVVTIVPCKECHEHPCACALLGPTKE